MMIYNIVMMEHFYADKQNYYITVDDSSLGFSSIL